MHQTDGMGRCWLCEKHRSERAPRGRGWLAQICRRPQCAESKRLLVHLLQKIAQVNGNADSIAIEVHHYYHHTSHPGEADVDRVPDRSELHAESLRGDRGVLPVCGQPPYVEAIVDSFEDIARQAPDRSTR